MVGLPVFANGDVLPSRRGRIYQMPGVASPGILFLKDERLRTAYCIDISAISKAIFGTVKERLLDH
jgi:hypothetical protein